MIRKGITLIVMLLFVGVGTIPPNTLSTPSMESEYLDRNPSHTVLGELGTITFFCYCKSAHQEALMYLFFNRGDDYPFYYVTHVYDKNVHAYQRVKTELGLTVHPTVFWDGGCRKDVGVVNNKTAVANYKKSINICKNRTVADIDVSVDATWLGAVNEEPINAATNIPINQTLTWTNTEMIVNVTVTNNGANKYNGHLHVYVCDSQSSMGWYDKFDRLYTMAFLDYAFNNNTVLDAGNTWDGSINWDGMDHSNGTDFYDKVTEDNTRVIASIFDRDNYNYADETTGIQVGVGTDPKTFDVYFGNKTPPPLVAMNITSTSLYPYYNISFTFNTTYYWRVDVCNRKGERIIGDIWNFTTRDNNPPNIPSNPFPSNSSMNGTICPVNFSWDGGDSDGDDVYYNVYFGEFCNLSLIAENITTTWYQDSQLLDFNTNYCWKVVAFDEFDYRTEGPIWYFLTQENLPPYTPSNPIPEDGEQRVPIDVLLCWVGGDPNPCDKITYDVYFSTSNPPIIKKSANQSEECYDPPGDLKLYRTYYWRVVSWDTGKLYNVGPVWSFTTEAPCPPLPPIIDGPTHGKAGVEYGYTFVQTNPEGTDICYFIDWGDNSTTGWTNYYMAGERVIRNHTWYEKGVYQIRAKSKDVFGRVSNWGYLEVTMPKSKNMFLGWFERFPRFQKILDVLRLYIG